MSEQHDVKCPVCKQHTAADALQSEGVLLSGIEAMFAQDTAMIEQLYGNFTQYDTHVAITLLAQMYDELAYLMGVDVRDALRLFRADVNAAQAED